MNARFVLSLAIALALCSAQPAHAGPLPLTNADVVRMVQGRLNDTTVIAAIEGEPHAFDVSPNALLALKRAGVSEDVIRAMLPKPAVPSTPLDRSPSGLEPVVAYVSGAQEMPMQPSVAQVFGQSNGSAFDVRSTLMQTAATQGLSLIHVPYVGIVGSLFGGFIDAFANTQANGVRAHTQWMIANGASSTVVPNTTPSFDVRYDESQRAFVQPAIVRLVPTGGGARIVREDMVVPAKVENLGAGRMRLTAESPLANGEYAIVLSSVPSAVWDFGIR
jgi:hypothetical protein